MPFQDGEIHTINNLLSYFQLGEDVICQVEGDLIDGESPTDSGVVVNVQTPANWPAQGDLKTHLINFSKPFLIGSQTKIRIHAKPKYLETKPSKEKNYFVLSQTKIFGCLTNQINFFLSSVKPMKAFTHGFTDSVSPDNGSNHPFFVNGE